MRALIVTSIYRPEMGALSNRMYPLVRHLVASGHTVSVATGMPNYPEGVVFPGYQGRRFMREEMDGAEILRTAYYTAPRNQSRKSQLRSYLSFLPAVFHSGLRAGPQDVVFVSSPPLFPAAAAMGLARRWGAPLVLDLRDLWPDEIIACGAATEGSRSVRLVRALERRAYRAAACVSCTTQAFVETVVERGVPRERTLLAPNGADLEVFRPLPANNEIAASFGLGDKFVVMYSGLLGIKHGLEAALEAADLLRDRRDIIFFFLGVGARRQALMDQAQSMGLDNVIFAGERPLSEIPYILARADVCLSCLLPDPYLEKIISVKMFEYMACGKPLVAAQAGEGARVVTDSGAGIVVPPGDGAAMATAILGLARDRESRLRMGELGRDYVERHYSRQVMATRLEEAMRGLVDGRKKKRGNLRAEPPAESIPRPRTGVGLND